MYRKEGKGGLKEELSWKQNSGMTAGFSACSGPNQVTKIPKGLPGYLHKMVKKPFGNRYAKKILGEKGGIVMTL